jgi:hypothetical protein
MGKYKPLSIRKVDRYHVRRNRMRVGIRETNIGRDYRSDDRAMMLATAIRQKDPKLRRAFTPEVAEKLS